MDDNWSVLVHHQYCDKIIKRKGESLVCCSQIYFAQNPCCVCKNVLALHWLKADVSRSNNVYSRSCFCLFKGVCAFLGVTGTKHVSACNTCTTCTHSELKIIERWKHDSRKHKKVNTEIWSKGIQHCTHKNLYFYVIILSWYSETEFICFCVTRSVIIIIDTKTSYHDEIEYFVTYEQLKWL